jgi:predicted SAM-dependent methyltransferase
MPTTVQTVVGKAMRELVKHILKSTSFRRFARQASRRWKLFLRDIFRTDNRLLKRYLSRQGALKLHVGCGQHSLDGWLNADISPRTAAIFRLDATERFPFGNDTFDFVFSEHMIEHIPHAAALSMLKECNRVLKKGGRIRISTPDMAFLAKLYSNRRTDLEERYIRWTIDNCVQDAPRPDAIFVINNFVRDWGHQFIYDENALRSSLEDAGFAQIERCEINMSRVAHLRELENEARLPDGFLKLETMTLEATKPW